jgi:transposase-like protein
MKEIKTLQQAIQHFSDYDNCREFMIAVRWADGKVRCPACESEKVTYLKNARLYRCYGDHTKQKFSLKVGTVFEDSPIPLEKWLPAVWLLVNSRNGISSYELHRAIGVTQKSAWFMLHRIRLAVQSGSFRKLGGEGGEVEVDETFVGGKFKNMHARKRNKIVRETGASAGAVTKTVVLGILDRDLREVRATVVRNTSRITLQKEVLKQVEHGTNVYTDQLRSYQKLEQNYVHEVVNHAETYVKGRVHTNGLENFWSLLKRGLNGTYVAVEPFHLFRYVDEQAFRYNQRRDAQGNKLNDGERFKQALSQIVGKRLTFAEVTGKVGQTPF